VADGVQRYDVVIVGGGIAGLAMAAALADSGLSLALVEARALPPPFSTEGDSDRDRVDAYDRRVSALTPKSMALLARLGAGAAIEAGRHCPYRHMTVWDAEGTGVIDFDAGEMDLPMLGSIVENRLITAALAQRVQRQGGLSLHAPASVASTGRADDGIALTLESGEALRAGLLVAADGALSPIRQHFAFRTREWNYGHRALVTTAAFEKPHELTAWQRFLPTGPLALLPLAGGGDRLCSIVWSVDEALADDLLALDDTAFCAALSDAAEARLGSPTACAARAAFPLRQRHAVDYVQPGVALVADAAHTIHPLAGQGINLGLADVEVLAEEILRGHRRGIDPGALTLLRRYQRRRKGENLAMMAAMDGFKRLFEQRPPSLRWLRNSGMRGVAALPPLKHRIMRQAMGL
jgi:2-octaprenylphenol hydroxylase